MADRLSPDSHVTPCQLRERMRRVGFADNAVGIASNRLHLEGYMEYATVSDISFNTFEACTSSPKGLQWIHDNQNSLGLRATPEPPTENDIPL
jgi:hypothetical protein